MPHPRSRARSRRRLFAALATTSLIGSLVVGAPAAGASPHDGTPNPDGVTADLNPSSFPSGRYLVRLREQPVAAYDGHLRGYEKTKPGSGQKLDTGSPAARRYAGYLKGKSTALLEQAGNPKLVYDYGVTFPGFAADLTAAQAAKLAGSPEVMSVTKDELFHLDAATRTSAFLGLEKQDGLWEQLGGTKKNGAGSGVIVGVIDSGIWPESPPFAPLQANKKSVSIPGWKGSCEAGEDNSFPVTRCNDKLIGARYYVNGFGRSGLSGEEFLSPRDGGGHGTHTSSTAAGDFGPHAVMPDGNDLGVVSGMAPAARVAMYKACWEGKASSGCAGADLVAAIDQAVADGVDVINYSIGSTSESSYFSATEVAFLYAAEAGVFVSASAGNSGPGTSTLDHPSPWLTTVAASTYAVYESTVETGSGLKMVGASTTPGLPDFTSLVDAKAAAMPGTKTGLVAGSAQICDDNTLDPAKVAGKVVLCDRGVNARVAKSLEVQRAGGVGMVLANPTMQGVNGDYHFVPTVHLENNYYDAIHKYAAEDGATVRILAGVHEGSTTQVPRVIEFSSRGPSTRAGGDVLKPDISAPGVDVLAAVAPPSNYQRTYDYMSGTSMAAPHIAGLAALVKQAHPDWSPMMIKSALMTTAFDTEGTTSPFAQGAGHVDPTAAVDPGLVYDAGSNDWWGFLNGQGCAGCPAAAPIAASDLNQASIAAGAMPGKQMVTRTVTKVGPGKETFTAKVDGLAGFTATVSPASITLQQGQSATFTVTFDRTSAGLNTWATGHLTWTSTRHTVRSPVALRAVAIKAPAEITGKVEDGSATLRLTTGFTGPVTSKLTGLAGATPVKDTVGIGADSYDNTKPASATNGAGVTKTFPVQVPTGSTYLRFDLQGNADDDLDLYAFLGNSKLAQSATAGSNERINVNVTGFSGTLTFVVHGYSAAGGATSAPLIATWWTVGSGDLQNAAVTPNPADATQGSTLDLKVSWAGLDPAKRYLGWVDISGGGTAARTYVSVG